MASGQRLHEFDARDNEYQATAHAAQVVRNNRPVLRFDATTQEISYFSFTWSRNWGGGSVRIHIHHAALSATSGTLGWLIALERVGEALDVDGDSFATDKTLTAVSVPATAGVIDIVTVDLTAGALDGIAVGEYGRIRIQRDVGNDNAAGDAELYKVEITEI